MRFDRKVIKVGEGKSLCLSLPSVIVEAYKIRRKDIITLGIYKIAIGSIEFTGKVYRTAKMLRIAIPAYTVIKYSIKPGIYNFEFIKNHREGIRK